MWSNELIEEFRETYEKEGIYALIKVANNYVYLNGEAMSPYDYRDMVDDLVQKALGTSW